MKIENVKTTVEFQPITVQITFETLAELHGVKTAVGMNTLQGIYDRVSTNDEQQSGNSGEYYRAVSEVYKALDNEYQVAIKRQSFDRTTE